MSKLAELLSFLFSKALGRATDVMGANAALRVLLVGKYVAVVGVGYATVAGIISSLNFVVSDDLSRAMSWVVPDNAVACIGACVSAAIARSIIDHHGGILRMLKG
ncbi:MAG: DUF5455 family protein [Neptuniibacter sp.]